MELCAEMLAHQLQAQHAERLEVTRLCPPFRRRAGKMPGLGRHYWAFNTDRLINRLWDFPRFAKRQTAKFDLFHVCDHSYAQLLHALPADRTGVYCHDLDTFSCLLDPSKERRPRWFRAMMRHVLRGLQGAAVVFHSTAEVRRQILVHGLIDPLRLVHAPLGVPPEFTPVPAHNVQAAALVADDVPFLLHVGSCIPRKRIDVLLHVFAGVRRRRPQLRLVKIGGPWTADQAHLLDRLGLGAAVVQATGLPRTALAWLYHNAAAVLLPSEAEGFGLPVIEALACGAAVVATDLPVLREVGGEAVLFCPMGDVPAWVESVDRVLTGGSAAPPLEKRLAQAAQYSWAAHGRTIAGAYLRLLG
jgi:glycosyltransferase involved in cell wall biosynthesis